MPNYRKTEAFFKQENVPYDRFKTGDQMSEERFFEQVKNPVTGDFFQLDMLKAAGAIPSDFTLPPGFENKRFPVITVNSIYRMKASKGKEYLKSRQMYYGQCLIAYVRN